MRGIDSGDLMYLSVMLENDSYVLILFGYREYKR